MASPKAIDMEVVEADVPQRSKLETYRILRDTQLARALKVRYGDTCQICGTQIALSDGKTYSEAHHIRPLGHPHNGPDVAENILILCPNCHVRCDYGTIVLSLDMLRLHPGHQIGVEYIL